MKLVHTKILLLPFILIWLGSDLASQQKVPVCAFLPFDNRSGFDNKNWDIVTGIPEILADSLLKSMRYQIIELDIVNAYLTEQKVRSYQYDNLNVLNRMATDLKIDYLIQGQINKFGLSRVNVSSFLVGGYESYRAEMEIEFFVYDRVNNIKTESYTCSSEIKRKDLGLKLIGKPSEHYVNFDELDKLEFNSPEFKMTIVGEALKELTADFVYKFMELYPVHLSGGTTPLDTKIETYDEATIVFIRDNEIYLNAGTAEKINVGEILRVYKKDEPIFGPDSSQAIGYADKLIGTIKITIVKDNHLSVAEVVEQFEPIKVKDKVRIRKRQGDSVVR